MIELKVEPYCHSCTKFTLDYGYDFITRNYVVYCKHAKHCRNLAKHIKKELSECK